MKSFRFSKSVDALAKRIASAPDNSPMSRREIFQGVLSIPDFPKHLAWQLNDISSKPKRRQYWQLCWEFIQTNKVPDPDAPTVKESFHGRLGFKGFYPDDFPEDEKRPGDIYPLKRIETRKARAYLHENPQMHAANAGIQLAISTYLSHLSNTLVNIVNTELAKIEDITTEDLKLQVAALQNNLGGLVEGAQSHSFLRDMSPILASAFADQPAEQMLTADYYRAGLLFAFRRNAFLGAAPANGNDFSCPFRHFFAQVYATKVEGSGDGAYRAEQGDKITGFGSLLTFYQDYFSGDQYQKPMQKVAEQIPV